MDDQQKAQRASYETTISEWKQLVQNHPELKEIENSETGWLHWYNSHPELHTKIPVKLWQDKEEAFLRSASVPQQTNNEQVSKEIEKEKQQIEQELKAQERRQREFAHLYFPEPVVTQQPTQPAPQPTSQSQPVRSSQRGSNAINFGNNLAQRINATRNELRNLRRAFTVIRTLFMANWWILLVLGAAFLVIMVGILVMGGTGGGGIPGQTATSSGTIVNNPPPPSPPPTGIIVGQPNNELATDAKIIMDGLISACGTYVANGDASCLDDANIPDAVRSGFFGSLGFRGVLECLGFVQTVFLYFTGEPLIAPANITKDIPPNNIPNGYTFIASPSYGNPGAIMEEGDIPIWDYDTYGHIGITVQTDASGVNFVFAEANDCEYACGKIDYAPDDINDPHLEGWIRKQ